MPAISPSAPSPAASALAAASASPTGNAPAQPGDFNSQLDAASQPSAPAPVPAPASPVPAPSAPVASTDDGEGEPKEGDDAPAPTDSTDDPAAALAGMAALLASLASAPLPPAPPTGAPAFPTAPASDAEGEGDSPAVPASGSVDLAVPTLPGVALGSGSAVTSPAALASAAASQPFPAKVENNTAPLPKDGNNVPSATLLTTQAAPVIGDQAGQNGQKNGSDDSDSKKSPQNDPLAPAFPASAAVSGQLGTLYSDVGTMPAVMEKNAAAPAPAGDDAAQAMGAALAAIAPTKVGTTFSVASFLRGYPVSPNRDREAGNPAPAAPAQASALAQNAAPGSLPEKAVTLTSNTQFVDVIRQALDDRPMVAPQRIAVELQTPPGATVTVFFSQANGQLRAQLSASDSGSLQWLQQQVGNLRDGGGTASTVVWLPPQLDQQQGGDASSQQQRQQEQQRQAAPPSAEDMAMAETLFGGTEAGMEAARN